QWPEGILALMQKRSVYADMSYFGNFMENKRADIWDFLDAAYAMPIAPTRIMYGSDWSMIARERWASNYFTEFSKAHYERYGQASTLRFLGENARDYLGLNPGNQNFGRLVSFYT